MSTSTNQRNNQDRGDRDEETMKQRNATKHRNIEPTQSQHNLHYQTHAQHNERNGQSRGASKRLQLQIRAIHPWHTCTHKQRTTPHYTYLWEGTRNQHTITHPHPTTPTTTNPTNNTNKHPLYKPPATVESQPATLYYHPPLLWPTSHTTN